VRGLAPVVVVENWWRGSERDGEVVGYAHVHPGRASDAAAKRLKRRILRLGRATGGRVLEASVAHPFGLSFVLVLQSRHPARFLRDRVPPLLDALQDRWTPMEGAYFEVVDSRGRFVWVTAGSSRLSEGAGRIRPDLEGCNPTPPMSEPMGHKVPRCPV
jgi:hypothetical protein